ncbi:MAG: DUF4190 domain-containing protein [Homoserinimonas sp.]
MSTPNNDEKDQPAEIAEPTSVITETPPATATLTPPKPKSPLATSATVVGIVAIVCAVIPGLSFVAFLPAIAATVLGIIALAARKPRRGRALTGVILGPIALLVAIIVSVSAISAGVNSIQDADAPEDSSVSDRAEDPIEEVAEEPEEVEVPEPVVVPKNIVYEGSGDSILAVTLPDGLDSAAVATISHVGSSNFAIWSLDAGMNQDELMVNTIGNYQGTVLFNNSSGVDISSLEISADGAWTVTVRSMLSLREFDGTAASGVGDDVVIYHGGAGAANISHDGSSNFAIWTYGDGTDLVVNEIGAYTGTTRWTAGPSIVVVSADGSWSITVG